MNIPPSKGICRRCGMILSLICVLAGSAAAADLGWNNVVAEAKSKNPALVKAAESLDQARWALKSSYSNFLPQVSANAGATHSDADDRGYSRSYSYGLSGSLSLFTGFADAATVRSRSYDVRIAEENYARTLSDTLYSLRKSFVDLLWAQETVRLSQDILKQREQNYDMVQLKYESGREDKGSLMRIDADRIQARFDLEKAQRALSNASLALVKAIGRDDFSVITVTGTLVPGQVPGSVDLRQLIAQTPEHLVAQYSIGKAEADITTAKSAFYPDLKLSAGTSRSGPQWAPETGQWNAGLTLSLPLFTGGRDYYSLKTASSAKTVAQQTLRQMDEQLAVKLNSSYNSFVDAAGNVDVREKYLTASDVQARISTTKYINGLTSYQDWYTIENDYISSQKSLLNARHDAVLAEAQFKNNLGAGEY